MRLSDEQKKAVLSLPGQERYKHFVKQVADSQQVWGLYAHGWALAETTDGKEVLPFWPAKEYAKLCAVDEWQEYAVKRIALGEFFALLAQLETDQVLPGVFYTPQDKGVTPSARELVEALKEELAQYE